MPIRPLSFQKATLGNGLDVLIRRQDQVPLVSVNLWYHVGSKDEDRTRRGYAHLFEHLMFEGSEHYPGDFFKPLQRLGAGVNGSTSSDRTNYFEDLPTAHFELALAMESDRMGFLLPALSDEKIEVQKGVVTNEYRQNYANRPYGQVQRLIAEAMYPAAHPYSWTTIGAMEDVAAATRADLEAFFTRFYAPANASLCLVGDLDEDRAFELAERYFGPIPGGMPALRPETPPARLDGDRAVVLRERVELDRGYLSWHTVPQFDPDDAPLALLADLLGRGRSSRLYRQLVLETGLAQDVSAYQWGRELAGSFAVVVTMRPGRAWAEVRERIDAQLADLTRHVDEDELARVRTGRVAAFVYALDNIGGFGGVADRLNAYNTFLGDPGRITADLARFEAVTADDIRRVAARYLARDSADRVELSVEGDRSRRVDLAKPLDRAVVPLPSPASSFRPPRPEVRRLACGVPLWVVPRRDLPIVSASVVLRAGAGVHGPERGGLAELTAAVMDEGTATRSVVELAEAAESIGSSLSSTCGWDGSYVGLRCLADQVEPTLDLAVDVLRNPSFPEAEFVRVRAQSVAQLRAERDRAEARAYRAFLGGLYTAGHPYSLPSDGSAETVESIGREELAAFHRERYRPDRACWIVAGDVDPDRMVELLDRRLRGWDGRSAALPPIPGGEPSSCRRIVVEHRPGATQAALRIGQVGIDRHDPDFLDLMLFNQVLGGMFTSRLNARLREEKGLTYGIRSSFDHRRGAGPFSIASAVQMDRVAEALADATHEVEALLDDRPPTAKELDDARQAIIEGQARQFETPGDLVSRLAALFLYDLPMDEYENLPGRLAGVTVDSAVAAARRRLRPEGFLAVVVADADQVTEPLRRIGWGEVEIRK